MYKRFAYLALLISLVGQFLLAPAMAMPKFLHASAHVQQEVEQQLTHQSVQPMPFSSTVRVEQDSTHCGNSSPSINTSIIDCDALCEILGTGDCVSHCISTPAIIEQIQLDFASAALGQSLQTVFWSPQTAEQSLINPPPIALHA